MDGGACKKTLASATTLSLNAGDVQELADGTELTAAEMPNDVRQPRPQLPPSFRRLANILTLPTHCSCFKSVRGRCSGF